jgi:prepilin peptidase CpaA
MPTSPALATTAILALAAGALSWSAVVDVRRFIIPNIAPATVAIAFLMMSPFMPTSFLVNGVFTGIIVLAIGVFVFARGWMGGGDVKLFAAASLWAGIDNFATFAVATSLAAGALALVVLSPIGRMMPLHPAAMTLGRRPAHRQPMPFGVAVAAGGVYLIFNTFAAIH